MATYLELKGLFSDPDLVARTNVAIVVAANSIAQNSTSESAERLVWAKRALGNPLQEARKAVLVALAENSTATVAQIQGASDAQLQANIDSAVPVLVIASTSGF